jgi:hypothetical protein
MASLLMKTCGTCTLCCELLPVKELEKGSFTRCPLSREVPHAKVGCSIYARRPFGCRNWSCVWLVSPGAPDEYRPDRVGFVVDQTFDLVQVEGKEMAAAQIWVKPGHEEDWRDSEAAHQYIATLLGLVPVVLWRLPPGTHARSFLKAPDGGFIYTEPTPYLAEYPSEAERQRRLRTIFVEGQK